MCLALAGKIVAMDGAIGSVLIDGRAMQISLIAVPGAVVGDHVLVSFGMAVEKITQSEADAVRVAWAELTQFGESKAAPHDG